MSYCNDTDWIQAKQYTSKSTKLSANDWAYTLSVYYILGGKHISIYCRLGEEAYQILGVVTKAGKNKVLVKGLNTKESSPIKDSVIYKKYTDSTVYIVGYDTVYSAPKTFYYTVDNKEELTKLNLDTYLSIDGKLYIEYKK